MAKENKDTRTRNWTIVVYPDSAPDNWKEIIDSMHIEWVESPLHNKDLNADGSPKKAHWHILLMFGGVKSYEQVIELIEPLNCPIPKKVHNTKSLVRYMSHLDNPDKFQYAFTDIFGHGGVDVSDLLKPSSSERYSYIREMIEWCNSMQCTEFQDLFCYASTERFEDWFPLLSDSCAYVMIHFLNSKRHKELNKVHFDRETGEIKD